MPSSEEKKKLKTIALLVSPLTVKPLVQDFPFVKGEVPDEFKPFISEGFMSLPGCPASKQPVKILQDTAASQSILLKVVLPFDQADGKW